MPTAYRLAEEPLFLPALRISGAGWSSRCRPTRTTRSSFKSWSLDGAIAAPPTQDRSPGNRKKHGSSPSRPGKRNDTDCSSSPPTRQRRVHHHRDDDRRGHHDGRYGGDLLADESCSGRLSGATRVDGHAATAARRDRPPL